MACVRIDAEHGDKSLCWSLLSARALPAAAPDALHLYCVNTVLDVTLDCKSRQSDVHAWGRYLRSWCSCTLFSAPITTTDH